jgi:sacsin
MVMSGNTLLYMDPSMGQAEYCTVYETERIKGNHLKLLLNCLEGVFGISAETFSKGSGGFPGTLFWFPLRQVGGELSSTVYTREKVDNLLAAFRSEAPSMLLFLNNIERVSIYSRDDTCGPGIDCIFDVGLAETCRERVRQEKRKFVEAVRNAGDDDSEDALPAEKCCFSAELTMEVLDRFRQHADTGSTSRDWLVVCYHPGRGDMSDKLMQLCADPNLSYRPYVGVAVPLDQLHRPFQSQLFCFLPLPLDTHSPTGLPAHVNGFFSLTSNRRQVNWPTADKLENHAELESTEQWNCLLVQELVPQVYWTMLTRYVAIFFVLCCIRAYYIICIVEVFVNIVRYR